MHRMYTTCFILGVCASGQCGASGVHPLPMVDTSLSPCPQKEHGTRQQRESDITTLPRTE